jgi:RimJ/RimL family protein N-acetyltransferase
MPLKEIIQIITKKSFLQKAGTGNFVQLVRLSSDTFEFGEFKLDDELYPAFGRNLYDFCRTNSYVVMTDDRDYDRPKIKLLAENGFKIYYSKMIYTKNLDEHEFLYKDIFQYRTLEETGKEDFLKIFKNVLYDDPEANEDYRIQFKDMIEHAGTKYNPKKWFLVMLNGKPIGVILPQRFESKESIGGIFHIGLIPEERNKGYGKILFSKCLQLLKEDGIKKYIGSTNINNISMRKVFESGSCQEWFKRNFYKAV